MHRAPSPRFRRALTSGLTFLLVATFATPSQAAVERFRPFKLKTPDGTQHSLAAVLGKTTLVVFFFPTCTYCNAAFPGIQKLYDTYKDRGLSMVWINIVPDEEKLIESWQRSHGYTVPILLGGRSVQTDYKLTETPTHYLLDAQGNIISKHAGYKPGDENTLEQQIQRAIGQSQ